jgi:hypothetical protein
MARRVLKKRLGGKTAIALPFRHSLEVSLAVSEGKRVQFV